jgi:hypothetical protein
MNTSNVIRTNQVNAAPAPSVSLMSRVANMRRRITRSLFADDVVGNPLHEAWTADGQPLERMTPEQLAKSCASRHIVVPHSQGR